MPQELGPQDLVGAGTPSRSLDMRDDDQPFRVPKTAELVARDLRSKIVRGELKDGDTVGSPGTELEFAL